MGTLFVVCVITKKGRRINYFVLWQLRTNSPRGRKEQKFEYKYHYISQQGSGQAYLCIWPHSFTLSNYESKINKALFLDVSLNAEISSLSELNIFAQTYLLSVPLVWKASQGIYYLMRNFHSSLYSWKRKMHTIVIFVLKCIVCLFQWPADWKESGKRNLVL